jgi:uncharacterized repeat protein (TIGR03803 family)
MSKFNWGVRACGIFLLWATAAVGFPVQVPAIPPTVTFTTLHSFDFTDGYYPEAALVQAGNGNLYGATYDGGAGYDGTIFKITSSGTLTTLHSFEGTDGNAPAAALVQNINGNLFGTTYFGGATNGTCNQFYGCGTVFKITPSGKLTTLYNFCSQSGCTDGQQPSAGLVEDIDGNFYGTTHYGGANNEGMVFKITPGAKLTILHSFDYTDGEYPHAGLVQATDGNFYGTTSSGGANGVGTVFKITRSGTLSTLHSFSGYTDGASPNAIIQATSGDFYGTTSAGGPDNYGAIFEITPNGTLTTLHTFVGSDGEYPAAGLIQGFDGNFYGTTSAGGADGRIGTVYEITAGGTVTTLYSFCAQSDCADGQAPLAALAQDTNGTFYGTTSKGGANDDGSVFSLSVGLGPFVETQPTSGKVGTAVNILGTDLTGTTNVRFNGIESKFNVVSGSEIATMVPNGATTGPVRVITPAGKLRSNVPFLVMP